MASAIIYGLFPYDVYQRFCSHYRKLQYLWLRDDSLSGIRLVPGTESDLKYRLYDRTDSFCTVPDHSYWYLQKLYIFLYEALRSAPTNMLSGNLTLFHQSRYPDEMGYLGSHPKLYVQRIKQAGRISRELLSPMCPMISARPDLYQGISGSDYRWNHSA